MSEELDNLRALLNQLYADKYTLDERIQEIEILIDNLERGQILKDDYDNTRRFEGNPYIDRGNEDGTR